MSRSKYSGYLLAGLSSALALSIQAQQVVPDAKPPAAVSARVLSESQALTYWAYAQKRLRDNDFRTAIASLWFLQNSEGLSDTLRAQVDRTILQASKRQAELARTAQSRAAEKAPAPVAQTPSDKVLPDIPMVTLEQISSVAVARDSQIENAAEPLGNSSPEDVVNAEENKARSVGSTSIDGSDESAMDSRIVNQEADISWIGARAKGKLWKNDKNQLDYWIDIGSVSGDEKIFEKIEDAAGVST